MDEECSETGFETTPLFLDPETFTFFHGRSPLEHKNTLLNEIAEEVFPVLISE